MKTKRIFFIVGLIALFGICFTIMNKHYDELARYQYVTSENREIILEHLSTDDINYMISQQLRPEQFLPFIEVNDFNIRNTLWYSKAKEIQDASETIIVSFINNNKSRLEYSKLETLLKNYTYETLHVFYEDDNNYVKNADIVANPSAMYALIKDNETLYTYIPKDLASLDLPQVSIVENQSDIKVKQEIIEPLYELCEGIASVNNKTCGNLILTAGYISYEDQIPVYERLMLRYGKDKFQDYWDYPGQSEFQLGYSVRFQLAGVDERVNDVANPSIDRDSEQTEEEKARIEEEIELIQWLQDNAYKYGFIIRYPEQKQRITGKAFQPFTLRFVGEDIAKELHESTKVLDEYIFNVK